MFDFKDKVVLISGAAQGVGRVCALAFAERGAKLALCDINDKGGEETLRLVNGAGANGLYQHADVSVEAEVQRFIGATVERFGRLDVAVNNAAKEIEGPTLDLPSSAFDELIATNLKGVHVRPSPPRLGSSARPCSPNSIAPRSTSPRPPRGA